MQSLGQCMPSKVCVCVWMDAGEWRWEREREVLGWPALGAGALAVVLWCKLPVCWVSESVRAEQCVCVAASIAVHL